jgi:hypothetical protein
MQRDPSNLPGNGGSMHEHRYCEYVNIEYMKDFVEEYGDAKENGREFVNKYFGGMRS